jgi:hypothetical protein
MIQTPIELDQDPEPDIRRLPSSLHNHIDPETSLNHQPDRSTPESPISDLHAQTLDHGELEPRNDVSLHAQFHRERGTNIATSEKSTEYLVNPSTTIDNEKHVLGLASGPDVQISRPTSNRPKVRDFAVANIAQPIKRATEKLVPAKRDGPPDVSFGLPPNRPGTPHSAGAQRRERNALPNPGFKESCIVSRSPPGL